MNYLYRCTRKDLYRHNCIGRLDATARQGHYVVTTSINAAHDVMRSRFPGERFDVEYKGEADPLAPVDLPGDL